MEDINVSNHEEAFKYFIEFVKSGKGRKGNQQQEKEKGGVIELKRISVVCHRIVHGGPEPKPLIITEEELKHLDELSDLAPLYPSLHPSLLPTFLLPTILPFLNLDICVLLAMIADIDITMRRC